MAYLVNLTARAERDLAYLYAVMNADKSDAALDWYRGLKKAILSLGASPNRCPVTPENPRFRHLLYGNKPHIYRVIYRVVEKGKRVDILHIRHGARRRLSNSHKPSSRLRHLAPSISPRRPLPVKPRR